MKIFVLRRNAVLMYVLAFVALAGVYYIGKGYGEAMFTSADAAKKLPVYCVETPEKKIALTFDAAWGDEDTDALITVLDKNGVKASFFMVGGWVDRYPESVKKFHDAGHEILNHSDSHAHMSAMTQEEITKDVNACEEKIQKVTGESKKLFRAPYGEYNSDVIAAADGAGYITVQWDCDSLDWKDLSAADIETRIISKIKNGSIILMHNGAKNTPQALESLLPHLKEKGYSFVKASELIYKDNYKIDSSGKQIKTN